MSRKSKQVRFYCPKCEKKQLERGFGAGRLTWVCKYNAPSTKPWRANSKKHDRPPCGLVITHPDRNAKISDYHSILDLIVRDDQAIKHYLLENHHTIKKRGLEVLYAGELLDLVRLNDEEGIVAYIYFKVKWDEDSDVSSHRSGHPRELTKGAARYIKFRDQTVESLARNFRICLWAQKGTYYGQRNAPFKGQLTKDLRNTIVEWAAALDRSWPQLEAKTIAEQRRWDIEQKALQEDLRFEGKGPYIQLQTYDGEVHKVTIAVAGSVTPAQARAVAAIFSKKDVASCPG